MKAEGRNPGHPTTGGMNSIRMAYAVFLSALPGAPGLRYATSRLRTEWDVPQADTP